MGAGAVHGQRKAERPGTASLLKMEYAPALPSRTLTWRPGLSFCRDQISVPSGNLNLTLAVAPRASPIFSHSSTVNFPVFSRLFNSCGDQPRRRASSEFDTPQYSDLESRVAEISAASEEAAAALKTVEHRLGEMAVLIKNVTTYKQTRPVAMEYRRAADKARFRQEHESALILYEAAGRALREGGVKKLPDLAALKAEYARLSEEKERLYAKYGEVKKELKEYGIIKQNVDGILRVTPRQQERKQEL
mgnify:CR=1 FL=1